MSKKILDELQFEKNKREILKRSQKPKYDPTLKQDEPKKYAWEYELENYRKSKVMDKFHTFGSICGILALILTLWLNWDALFQFLMKF
jgi:hypothetical protein